MVINRMNPAYCRVMLDPDDPNVIIIKLKLQSKDEIITYTVKNGYMFLKPVSTTTVYNSMTHYSFYDAIFKSLPKEKMKYVCFIADDIYYKVPYGKFLDLKFFSSSSNSLDSVFYIPRTNLMVYAVENFIYDNVLTKN